MLFTFDFYTRFWIKNVKVYIKTIIIIKLTKYFRYFNKITN